MAEVTGKPGQASKLELPSIQGSYYNAQGNRVTETFSAYTRNGEQLTSLMAADGKLMPHKEYDEIAKKFKGLSEKTKQIYVTDARETLRPLQNGASKIDALPPEERKAYIAALQEAGLHRPNFEAATIVDDIVPLKDSTGKPFKVPGAGRNEVVYSVSGKPVIASYMNEEVIGHNKGAAAWKNGSMQETSALKHKIARDKAAGIVSGAKSPVSPRPQMQQPSQQQQANAGGSEAQRQLRAQQQQQQLAAFNRLQADARAARAGTAPSAQITNPVHQAQLQASSTPVVLTQATSTVPATPSAHEVTIAHGDAPVSPHINQPHLETPKIKLGGAAGLAMAGIAAGGTLLKTGDIHAAGKTFGAATVDKFIPGLSDGFKGITDKSIGLLDRALNAADTATQSVATAGMVATAGLAAATGTAAVVTAVTAPAALTGVGAVAPVAAGVTTGGLAAATAIVGAGTAIAEGANLAVNLLSDGLTSMGLSHRGGMVHGIAGIGQDYVAGIEKLSTGKPHAPSRGSLKGEQSQTPETAAQALALRAAAAPPRASLKGMQSQTAAQPLTSTHDTPKVATATPSTTQQIPGKMLGMTLG